MSFLDKFRKKPQELPRSDRDKKIEEISRKAQDEDYELRDYMPDETLAELAEDRSEYGEDLNYPLEPVPTMDEVLDEEWVKEKILTGKRQAKAEESARVKRLKKLYPNSSLDWSRGYAQVCGIPGVVWTQDGRYFDTAGREVLDPEI